MKIKRYHKGFTLVEIMIVIAIIGFLAVLGIPSMLHAGIETRCKRFAREITTVSHAFIRYSAENGSYPADRNPAQMPDGMDPYLANFPWTEETVIGGNWDWDYNVFGVVAGISVKSPNWDVSQMGKIDEIIDDGNLSTGDFRSRTDGYIYIIEH